MKSFPNTSSKIAGIILTIVFSFVCINVDGQIIDTNKPETNVMWQTDTLPQILWAVKAYRPDSKLLRVKAIDDNGIIHDVKAIQTSNNTSVLGVKAIINEEIMPIKMIVNETDRYLPVKAITKDGTLVSIKALTDEGEVLDVKGVSKTGSIVHIRAIENDGTLYNVVAISPDGYMNDVKGVKMADDIVETTVRGVKVYAHVKAIHQ